jgi:hypothetical protein
MRNPILAAALLLALAGCKSSTGPDSITVCETNTARLCTAWVRSGKQYVADWAQGSHAIIKVSRFDNTAVSFVRDDPSGTSAGMHAVYSGTPSGHSVRDGVVTWTYNGDTFSGTWTADW